MMDVPQALSPAPPVEQIIARVHLGPVNAAASHGWILALSFSLLRNCQFEWMNLPRV
jgi:hypothetical protein